MGCRPSKHATSKIRDSHSRHSQCTCVYSPRKYTKKHKCNSTGNISRMTSSATQSGSFAQTNGDQRSRSHRSDDSEFPAFSTTTAVYRKSSSKASKITLRLSCDGSMLEIEQCDYDIAKMKPTKTKSRSRPWSSAPNLKSLEREHQHGCKKLEACYNMKASASAWTNVCASLSSPPQQDHHVYQTVADPVVRRQGNNHINHQPYCTHGYGALDIRETVLVHGDEISATNASDVSVHTHYGDNGRYFINSNENGIYPDYSCNNNPHHGQYYAPQTMTSFVRGDEPIRAPLINNNNNNIHCLPQINQRPLRENSNHRQNGMHYNRTEDNKRYLDARPKTWYHYYKLDVPPDSDDDIVKNINHHENPAIPRYDCFCKYDSCVQSTNPQIAAPKGQEDSSGSRLSIQHACTFGYPHEHQPSRSVQYEPPFQSFMPRMQDSHEKTRDRIYTLDDSRYGRLTVEKSIQHATGVEENRSPENEVLPNDHNADNMISSSSIPSDESQAALRRMAQPGGSVGICCKNRYNLEHKLQMGIYSSTHLQCCPKRDSIHSGAKEEAACFTNAGRNCDEKDKLLDMFPTRSNGEDDYATSRVMENKKTDSKGLVLMKGCAGVGRGIIERFGEERECIGKMRTGVGHGYRRCNPTKGRVSSVTLECIKTSLGGEAEIDRSRFMDNNIVCLDEMRYGKTDNISHEKIIKDLNFMLKNGTLNLNGASVAGDNGLDGNDDIDDSFDYDDDDDDDDDGDDDDDDDDDDECVVCDSIGSDCECDSITGEDDDDDVNNTSCIKHNQLHHHQNKNLYPGQVETTTITTITTTTLRTTPPDTGTPMTNQTTEQHCSTSSQPHNPIMKFTLSQGVAHLREPIDNSFCTQPDQWNDCSLVVETGVHFNAPESTCTPSVDFYSATRPYTVSTTNTTTTTTTPYNNAATTTITTNTTTTTNNNTNNTDQSRDVDRNGNEGTAVFDRKDQSSRYFQNDNDAYENRNRKRLEKVTGHVDCRGWGEAPLNEKVNLFGACRTSNPTSRHLHYGQEKNCLPLLCFNHAYRGIDDVDCYDKENEENDDKMMTDDDRALFYFEKSHRGFYWAGGDSECESLYENQNLKGIYHGEELHQNKREITKTGIEFTREPEPEKKMRKNFDNASGILTKRCEDSTHSLCYQELIDKRDFSRPMNEDVLSHGKREEARAGSGAIFHDLMRQGVDTPQDWSDWYSFMSHDIKNTIALNNLRTAAPGNGDCNSVTTLPPFRYSPLFRCFEEEKESADENGDDDNNDDVYKDGENNSNFPFDTDLQDNCFSDLTQKQRPFRADDNDHYESLVSSDIRYKRDSVRSRNQSEARSGFHLFSPSLSDDIIDQNQATLESIQARIIECNIASVFHPRLGAEYSLFAHCKEMAGHLNPDPRNNINSSSNSSPVRSELNSDTALSKGGLSTSLVTSPCPPKTSSPPEGRCKKTMKSTYPSRQQLLFSNNVQSGDGLITAVNNTPLLLSVRGDHNVTQSSNPPPLPHTSSSSSSSSRSSSSCSHISSTSSPYSNHSLLTSTTPITPSTTTTTITAAASPACHSVSPPPSQTHSIYQNGHEKSEPPPPPSNNREDSSFFYSDHGALFQNAEGYKTDTRIDLVDTDINLEEIQNSSTASAWNGSQMGNGHKQNPTGSALFTTEVHNEQSQSCVIKLHDGKKQLGDCVVKPDCRCCNGSVMDGFGGILSGRGRVSSRLESMVMNVGHSGCNLDFTSGVHEYGNVCDDWRSVDCPKYDRALTSSLGGDVSTGRWESDKSIDESSSGSASGNKTREIEEKRIMILTRTSSVDRENVPRGLKNSPCCENDGELVGDEMSSPSLSTEDEEKEYYDGIEERDESNLNKGVKLCDDLDYENGNGGSACRGNKSHTWDNRRKTYDDRLDNDNVITARGLFSVRADQKRRENEDLNHTTGNNVVMNRYDDDDEEDDDDDDDNDDNNNLDNDERMRDQYGNNYNKEMDGGRSSGNAINGAADRIDKTERAKQTKMGENSDLPVAKMNHVVVSTPSCIPNAAAVNANTYTVSTLSDQDGLVNNNGFLENNNGGQKPPRSVFSLVKHFESVFHGENTA